jgi:dCTP deaminase
MMISPFVDGLVSRTGGKQQKPVLSYGLSSYGYDVRLAEEFLLVLPNARAPKGASHVQYIDPKEPQVVRKCVSRAGEIVLVEPNQTLLGKTIETFHMPDDVVGHLAAKSTYARSGLTVNFTVLEPGWSGELTVEISNLSAFAVAIYPGEGIGQVVFHRGQFMCETSYADRVGKYQNQQGVVPSRIDSSDTVVYVED